jgi:mono/diheme cytochrome c family protein
MRLMTATTTTRQGGVSPRWARLKGMGVRVGIGSLLLAARCFGADYDHGEKIDPDQIPVAVARAVDFDQDVRPIFEQSCVRCHGPELARSRFRIDNREAALRGGGIGVAIVPGASADSPLIHYVTGLVEGLEMPPEGQGDRLTPEQVGVLRAWIDQGAQWSETPVTRTELSVSPQVGWIGVRGNEFRFREHQGMMEGWSGGIAHFELRQRIDPDTELRVAGRGLHDQGDHGLEMLLRRRELGFVRVGYDLYRRYYDDLGGYAPGLGTAPARLDRDLWLDIGRAWFDAGLTVPDLPRITIGYEYRWRDGERATPHWGVDGVAPGELRGPAVYPAFKEITERTHILKLDASHTLAGWSLDDQVRLEFHEQRNRKVHRGEDSATQIGEYRESYEHMQVANSLRAEKELRDWLFVSGGHLFTRLEGDGSFRRDIRFLTDPATTFTAETADRITLEQESHTLNANARLNPWEGVSLTAAVQAEWMRRRGFSGLLFGGVGDEFPQRSASDRSTVEERVGVRFDRIPFTVVYAEARFQQEWIDQFEQAGTSLNQNPREFLRATEATSTRRDVGGGFRISPWVGLALDTAYWHRSRKSDYDHQRDESFESLPFLISGNGYPAFIQQRKIASHEFQSRLTARPARWLRATLSYQLKSTDYDTVTDSVINPANGALFPGGPILAGRRDEHVYGAGLTWNLWRRLALTSSYAYSDVRSKSGIRDVVAIVPYRGDIHRVQTSATHLLNEVTDLRLSYAFSRADFAQDNAPVGLPLGIRYDHHGLMAGVTRHFPGNVTTTLQYGFFSYSEPTSAGAADYRAHALWATFGWALP